jgi:hypothetical protein
MAYQLEVKEEALQDIVRGFLWYEEKNPGLGTRFVDEVEQMITYLGNNALHFQIRNSVYREAVLKIFPYVIIYEIRTKHVVVYAVFPCKADPKKKRK